MFAHPSRKLFLWVLVVLLLLLATPHSAVTGQAVRQAIPAEFSVFNLCSDVPETVNFVATYRVFALDTHEEVGAFQRRFRLNIQAHGVGELSGSHYTYYAQRWTFVDFPSGQAPFEQLIEIGGMALGDGQAVDFPAHGILHFIVTPDGIDLVFEPSHDVDC